MKTALSAKCCCITLKQRKITPRKEAISIFEKLIEIWYCQLSHMFRIETMNLNFYIFYCLLILFNFGGLKYVNNKTSLLEKNSFKMKTTWINVSSFLNCHSAICCGFPAGSAVKNSAMQETRVWFLGRQNPLD